ncbi:helix-turn-helix transcriptional regulator [Nonomuraea sp. NPDC000554]|uniref:helix-turn-helix transcriptional regulator n=1 Tax=Nonomuraea sp. NPDC000554 TaxID=3154259 RepID=UPI00331E09D1
MYAEWAPDRALADRIACFWHQHGEADGVQLVVPDGCVDLIWGPGGLFVAGPDTGPAPVSVREGDTFTGIRFKPGAVGEAFGVPLQELRDQRVPLAALDALPPLSEPFPEREGASLGFDAVAGEPTPPFGLDEHVARRLRVLRAMVVARLRQTPGPDPAASDIAAALRTGRSVGEVAWHLGFSERQLQRRSVASFGYAPKTLQRIVRFQRALKLARAGVPLAEVAATAGYTDQPHLSNDVKRLSGVALGQLV